MREALATLKAESEAAAKAAARTADRPAAVERGAPSDVALSLACIGCARLPSEMPDGREKHPICDKCRELKLQTTYMCGMDCPANPGAWGLHGLFHKKLRKQLKAREDDGSKQQQDRETAEEYARHAAQTGDAYSGLLAEGGRYLSKEDTRRAARAYREAIALRPDRPEAYYNLGIALGNSGHDVDAAQWFLEAKKRYQVGSEGWAEATAWAFTMLRQEKCAEVAKPEWWNDEGLKALSARVVRLAPNYWRAHGMRGTVMSGLSGAWEVGPRPAAEFEEAAAHFDRVAALSLSLIHI